MEEKLTTLYNTMLLVETKGGSTKYMAACLQCVEELIEEERSRQVSDSDTAKE